MKSAACWLSVPLLLALSACAGMPIAPSRIPRSADATDTILIDRRGWHTDIGFLAADIASPLNSVRQDYGDARYLAFGFGDRRYLLARASRSIDLIGAVWPGDGLVLATALSASPRLAFGQANVIALPVTHAQALAAQRFVWQSIRNRNGRALLVSAGPYGASGYYGATQRYSGLHTCNTWVAQALRSAGVPVGAHLVFASQLWRQLKRRAAVQSRGLDEEPLRSEDLRANP